MNISINIIDPKVYVYSDTIDGMLNLISNYAGSTSYSITNYEYRLWDYRNLKARWISIPYIYYYLFIF